jgi:pilus assembly protein CpaE
VIEELRNLDCEVFIVDIGADIERALGLVEILAGGGEGATVMACSASAEPELLMRAMHAGAREFLAEPVPQTILAEALGRALLRHERSKNKKVAAKILIFAGAKGGAGTTMIATNFAVALTQEDSGKVVVVDLDVQLGEVALTLGLTPRFSILDAVQNLYRLDSDFVKGLLGRHTSGLSVLASPEQYASSTELSTGTERLFEILREDFAFVVVDAGPVAGNVENALLDRADTLYLVTERSIPSLRNARRMLTFLAGRERSPHLQIILNRFNSREAEIDESGAAKALGRPVDWKLPNDFPAVRTAENTGIPMVLKDSPISRVLRQMAKAACGKVAPLEKRSRPLLGIF